ncbi:hypothetical protein TTHERM_00058740 (macronuclear) [Tetrahymena thermophila SB210]|uniref:Deubiquitinating enzyme MINDY-3/4 conserved domain-containing protein n=1 Tax=Tetrahymena thermophila (strain SB210) TaxID=312017 RepID=I7M0D4_TETTS|nr:hypothetical protein TTHERM_00058740 [Tetrahymena thermophila SB210]EAR87362.1 hypothetical protein TTHERM_00058740 [Tetrahymena thermophila SB210]|eukprot:XP_001007607.1 hypothetical protein TTHERM_00058740 [Tetrahymena thermophila SB210]
MGCGVSKERETNSQQKASEPVVVQEKAQNLEDHIEKDQVVKLNNSQDLEDYKKNPVSVKNQKGNQRNKIVRNSQQRGIYNKNDYSGIDDIEEVSLNDNLYQVKQTEQANKKGLAINNQNDTDIEKTQTQNDIAEKQLNGFYLGNGYNIRRQHSNSKNKSNERSFSSESKNDLNHLHVSLDTTLQIKKMNANQSNSNYLNIQDQSQTNEKKTFNLFQKKQNNQNILERNTGGIEDLTVHILDEQNNKYDKNTSATFDLDTNDNHDIDSFFAINEVKPPLQKANSYLQFSLGTAPVLGYIFYSPDIDFTKENKQRQFSKDGIFNLNESKKAQPIDKQTADCVRNLLFGNSQKQYLPKSWSQGFILNEQDIFGLVQREGGPCGVIAVVQAYYIKYILLQSKIDESLMKKRNVQENCLLAALAEIIYKCRIILSKNNYQVKFVIAKQQNTSTFKSCDIGDCQVINLYVSKFEDLFNQLRELKEELIGNYNNGIINFLYSVLITKGVDNIVNSMDVKYNSLIGNHGHATQELVNLLITGESTSNCFDGVKELGQMKLFGIKKRQQIGFLSALECDSLIEVGKNYKEPYLPIWVICKENHYTILFAKDSRIIHNSLWDKFDLIFYDQLSEKGSFYYKITIEKDNMLRNNRFTRNSNDILEIISKSTQNILNVKWGSDILISWPSNNVLF